MGSRRGLGALAVEIVAGLDEAVIAGPLADDAAHEALIEIRRVVEGMLGAPVEARTERHRAGLVRGIALAVVAVQRLDAECAVGHVEGDTREGRRSAARDPRPGGAAPDDVARHATSSDPHGLRVGMTHDEFPDLGSCETEKPGCACAVCKIYDSLICACGVSHYDHPGFDATEACPTGFRLASWQGGPSLADGIVQNLRGEGIVLRVPSTATPTRVPRPLRQRRKSPR